MTSSRTRLAALCIALSSPLVVVALGAAAGGCNLNGDVVVNTQSGDMGGAPPVEDLSIPTFDLSGGCGLNTCATMNANCGPIGDGCGGVLNCGTCPGHQTCGGGGVPYQCGGQAGCIPLTCASLGLGCGPAGDGCGGMLDCGSCPMGQTCGGAGVAGKCGVPSGGGGGSGGGMDMGTLCMPMNPCATANANCGMMGDGCGNLVACGTMGGNCPSGQTCGGGGVPFQCGSPACMPKTCAQLGITCGVAGDGCGGIATGPGPAASPCGSSATGTCGGGGVPGQCGSPACTPKTCAQLGANCGQVSDGCGGIATGPGPASSPCGTCSSGQGCGAGGTPNVCGMPACQPKTCAQLGYNCGIAGDGCGGIATGPGPATSPCGSCSNGDVCGALQPNQCGNNVGGSNNQCDMGSTTITGTVVAGTDSSKGFGNPDPVYNATVFIPSGAVSAMPVGVPACDQCTASMSAIVQATTGVDGKFTLTNPPTGNQTLVIQLGRWRRVIHINVVPCTNNVLTTAQTHLPRIQGGHTGAADPMDNIPQFAISTGNVDALECVLRKMGIDDSEFTNPGSTFVAGSTGGRVQLYQATSGAVNGAGGAIINNSTPDDSNLWGTQTAIDGYDAVLFPCTGGQDNKTSAAQNVVTTYANSGGRVFATHYSYVWTYNTYNNTTAKVPWGCGNKCTTSGRTLAAWQVDTQYSAQFQGFVDQTFPKGVALTQWLTNLGVGGAMSYGSPSQNGYSIPVNVVRRDVNGTTTATGFSDGLTTSSQQWLFSPQPPNQATFPLHFTFNTDVTKPAAQQCGRVVFSDFHVEDAVTGGVTFPNECGANAPLTPQEKLLEFMLFDLTSCVQPDVPTCTPKSCSQLGATCGIQGDGCGGIALNTGGTTSGCGTCPSGQVCTNGTCTGGCVPKTCAQLGATCGQQGDGCGGIALNGMGQATCGTCPSGQSCINGTCVGSCTPKTCAQLGATCGVQGDGCGGIAQPNPCGTCTPPQTCGGGGVPNQCGGGCTPLTCAQLGLNCGPAGNGCGGSLNCGSCPTGQTCGGGGVAGQCGAPPDGGVKCMPLTCAAQGISCGAAGDGCGNLLDCGPCPPGQTCGGGGTPGQCGAPSCTPTTCAAQNANCGIIGDGCGGTLNCGTCVAPETCGGGGMAFQCGVLL